MLGVGNCMLGIISSTGVSLSRFFFFCDEVKGSEVDGAVPFCDLFLAIFGACSLADDFFCKEGADVEGVGVCCNLLLTSLYFCWLAKVCGNLALLHQLTFLFISFRLFGFELLENGLCFWRPCVLDHKVAAPLQEPRTSRPCRSLARTLAKKIIRRKNAVIQPILLASLNMH